MSADVISIGTSLATRRMAVDITVLVEREAPGLLAYFMRRAASPDDAADLLGDTLVIIWRRTSAIPDDDTRARMWMYGVARKVLSGYRRGARRRTALTDRLRDQLEVMPVSPVTEAAVADDVLEALGQLAELDREIIRLAYWEGFSLVEIGGILSLRPGTVRSRHARAMAKLRTALEAERESD